jgi:hypothetical protein
VSDEACSFAISLQPRSVKRRAAVIQPARYGAAFQGAPGEHFATGLECEWRCQFNRFFKSGL